MSPRRPRRRESSPPLGNPGGMDRVEEWPDGEWKVRMLTGASSTKIYRCPGCDQEIRPGTPHVVTWPAYPRDSDLDPWDTESSADWRRHWHTACWRARGQRR